MNPYLAKKEASFLKKAVEPEDTCLNRVYAIDTDYRPLLNYIKKYRCAVFLDDYKYPYKDFSSVCVVKDLFVIFSFLRDLKDSMEETDPFYNMIVIDSTDFMSGDILDLHSFCVQHKIGITFVAGMTQSDAFFKYNAFLRNCAGPVFKFF
jgi:hypothetical protein